MIRKYKGAAQAIICEEYIMWVMTKHPTYTNHEIINIVTDGMKIPRSSVRRIKSELLSKLIFYTDILEEKNNG